MVNKSKFEIVKETKNPGDTIKYNSNGIIKEGIVRWNAEVLPDSHREVIWISGEPDAIDLNDIILQ